MDVIFETENHHHNDNFPSCESVDPLLTKKGVQNVRTGPWAKDPGVLRRLRWCRRPEGLRHPNRETRVLYPEPWHMEIMAYVIFEIKKNNQDDENDVKNHEKWCQKSWKMMSKITKTMMKMMSEMSRITWRSWKWCHKWQKRGFCCHLNRVFHLCFWPCPDLTLQSTLIFVPHR